MNNRMLTSKMAFAMTLSLCGLLMACNGETEQNLQSIKSNTQVDAVNGAEQTSDATKVAIEVYKSPTCGCCGEWVAHINDGGFSAQTTDTDKMASIKEQLGIAPRYQSCHTGVADGYVFEGHIPAHLMQRFLDEKPANAIGLAVPGMPVGSPGMEIGDRHDDYDVLLLKKDGSSEVYAHVTADS